MVIPAIVILSVSLNNGSISGQLQSVMAQQPATQQPISNNATAMTNSTVPDEYIIVLKNETTDTPDTVAKEARTEGAEILHVYKHAIKGFAIRIENQTILDSFKNDSRIAYVDQVQIGQARQQTIPRGIDRVDADFSSTRSGDGRGVVNVDIAIVDTGIDLDHPDLYVYRQTTFVRGTASGDDDNGHGTHVAGIAAARDNTIGVVGVAPGARLWAIKALDSAGSLRTSDLIAAIDYVTANANEIEVANLSLGGGGTAPTSLTQAISRSIEAGITYVVAVANSGMDSTNSGANASLGSWPENHPQVIAVSNIADFDGRCGGLVSSNDDRFSISSNFGSVVDMAAPGTNIQSTWPGGTYRMQTGASMSTPHVSGAAALYKAEHPTASPATVSTALRGTGSTSTTVCDTAGHGYFTGDPDSVPEPLLYMSRNTPPITRIWTVVDGDNRVLNNLDTVWNDFISTAMTMSNSITVYFEGSGNQYINRFECKLDSSDYSSSNCNPGANVPFAGREFSITGFSDHQNLQSNKIHRFCVKAVDVVDNRGDIDCRRWWQGTYASYFAPRFTYCQMHPAIPIRDCMGLTEEVPCRGAGCPELDEIPVDQKIPPDPKDFKSILTDVKTGAEYELLFDSFTTLNGTINGTGIDFPKQPRFSIKNSDVLQATFTSPEIVKETYPINVSQMILISAEENGRREANNIMLDSINGTQFSFDAAPGIYYLYLRADFGRGIDVSRNLVSYIDTVEIKS